MHSIVIYLVLNGVGRVGENTPPSEYCLEGVPCRLGRRVPRKTKVQKLRLTIV